MIDIEPPPFWAKQLGRPGRVDRWQIIYFQAPSTIAGDVGVALTGTGAQQDLPGRQRVLPRGDHAGDGEELPLLLELRPNVPKGRRAAHPRHQPGARQQRPGRLRSGPRGPRGAAEGDRQEPETALLQPQHRCRGPLGPPDDRPDARTRVRSGRARAGRSSRVGGRCRNGSNGGAAVALGAGPHPRHPALRDRAVGRVRGSDARQPYQRDGADRRPARPPLLFDRRALRRTDYRIAVKLLPDTRGGSAYMWSLVPGPPHDLHAGQPFRARPRPAEYLLLAGGIGITSTP